MTKQPPHFDGYQPSQVDFDASRTGLITPFRKIDIDVSVAPTGATTQYTQEGDFIYQDLDPVNSNGNVTIEFNRQQDADNGPIWMVPGLAIPGTFKGFKLNWAVQANKKVRLIYSTGSRILPAAASISSIGSISTPVGVQGPRLISLSPAATDLPLLTRDVGSFSGANYASSTNIAANGTSAVFLAAANVNGAILNSAQASSASAAVPVVCLIAKATAPTTTIDGALLYVAQAAAAGLAIGQRLERPRYIPPGLGLFWFSASLETGGIRSTDYTLL